MSTIFARFPEIKTDWAFVGFHDRFKEGEYVTIFGQPLNETGFTRWASPDQPNNWGGAENCGSVHRNGGLNDGDCSSKIPFICEYDLSWIVILTLLTITSCGATQTVKKALSFTMSSRVNQTGHAVTQLSLDKSLPHFSDQWNLKVNQAVTETVGLQKFHLDAVFAVVPPKPSDYEYFPGVGYYKFHTTFANGFEDASSKCAKEGGHLAIVNSESEHQVLSTIFERFPESSLKAISAFVGFHDREKEGEFVTIFGQPLNTTGLTRWSSAVQPDNYAGAEDCGSVHRNGGFNDIGCSSKIPFFCEYDLSWN
ncbi:hypothetical protein J437_LFUL017473 [Ladona fulva]|uniref:C-type lectin domain-containing protein n=1 Tax=Ladona fulva TaxID=123851 RepID=A0A8K0P8Q0_LADFU|nr:hypothetical protein J437_LFUL017473 [Ladona fulva]